MRLRPELFFFSRFAIWDSNNRFKETITVPLVTPKSTSERQGRRLNDFTEPKNQEAQFCPPGRATVLELLYLSGRLFPHL